MNPLIYKIEKKKIQMKTRNLTTTITPDHHSLFHSGLRGKKKQNISLRCSSKEKEKPWVVDQALETVGYAHLQGVRSGALSDLPHYLSV